MGTRVTKVSVQADLAQYNRAFVEAAYNTEKLAAEGDKLARNQQMFRNVGLAGVAMGGLLAAGIAMAIGKAAEFDQAMSAVQAATHASAGEMDKLRAAAIAAATGTKFSAIEAANGIEELSKAGISTKDIIGGALKGALDLAAAGEMSVADAAGVAATTLGQFGLQGDKASHVADLLAAGAGKAMGDVSDLSQALAQSGTVAAQFGVSIDDTVGSLAAFASKGLLGSDAGTSFRTMLLRLANPTGQAATLMQQLGIHAYDAGGKFVGMAGLAGQLQKALGGLTQEQRNAALATIFGQDAIRAANVLYVEGAKGIQDWTSKVNDTGYAADTAAKRLDNLKGDLTKLKTAFDNALIGIGEDAQSPLRVVAQALTQLLDGFNKLPAPAKDAMSGIALLTAGVGLVGGAALLAIPKLAALKIAMIELGVSSDRVTTGMGAAGRALSALGKATFATVAIGAGVQAVDALADAISKRLLPSAEQIDNQMRTAKSGLDLFTAALHKEGITNTHEAAAELKNLGAELDAVANSDFFHPANTSGAARTIASQLADIANSGDMAKFSAQFRKLGDDAGLTSKQLRTYIADNPDLEDALTKQANAAGLSADRQTLLNIAMGNATTAQADATSAADDAAAAFQAEQDKVDQVKNAFLELMKQINDSNNVNQNAISTNAAWQDGLAGLKDQVKKLGNSLDESTPKGSANASMLADLAGKAQTAAEAQYEVDQKTMSAKDSTDKYLGTLADQRQKFIDSAVAAGFNKDEVSKLADRIFQLPDAKAVKILLDKADAEYQLQQLTRTREVFVKVRYDQSTDSIRLGNGRVNANGGMYQYGQAFADGGLPNGIYKGGAPLYKFAEPETGWEAFLSGKASERRENIGYWLEAGRRLGVAPPQAPQKTVQRHIHMDGTFYGFVPEDVVAAAQQADRYEMAVAGIGES